MKVYVRNLGGTPKVIDAVVFDSSGNIKVGATTIADANGHLSLRSYTVVGLPSAAVAGQMIYVSNESGGAVPAFSDGANWRRVTDRAIVS